MNRRDFAVALGFAAVAVTYPVMTSARSSELRKRIGVLIPFAKDDSEGLRYLTALDDEFRRLGWLDGVNLEKDIRWFGGKPERAKTDAQELVGSNVDAILVQSTPGLRAVIRETSLIPVVFVVVSEPVRQGFVKSLARPEANITGFSNIDASIAGKWIQFLKEVAPHVSSMVILYSPDDASWNGYWQEMQAIGPTVRVTLMPRPVRNSTDIESTFDAFPQEAGFGLIVMPNPVTTANHDLIVRLATQRGLPGTYPYPYFVKVGGLLSYGIDISDLYRRAGSYLDRILRGTNVAELPVQLPVKLDLVINLKTARTLGLNVPTGLLSRVSEVIE